MPDDGGLSERARRLALEIANDADPLIRAPRDRTFGPQISTTHKVPHERDTRLPPPGSYLEREYKGQQLIVKGVVDGFEFEGKICRLLSAIARAVTGTKRNGFAFFHIESNEEGLKQDFSSLDAQREAAERSSSARRARACVPCPSTTTTAATRAATWTGQPRLRPTTRWKPELPVFSYACISFDTG